MMNSSRLVKLLLSAWLCALCSPGRAAETATEYKLLLAPASWRAAAAAYKLNAPDKERDIYFYDTQDLALYARGLVLRARAGKKKGDTTVKFRPPQGPVPADVSAQDGFKCENDATLSGATKSCSLTAPREPADIAAVAAGDRKPRHLFTGTQRAWAGEIWEGLRPLGPIKSFSWEVPHPALDALAFERWDLPGGPSYYEVSFRASSGGEAGLSLLLKELAQLGIKPAARQSSKTLAAMEFFSRP
ncbi:MAG TPA: hypothetical protein DCZ92_00135 [Elusimicrobia bacterium]|nr:MAG: hypothetical protein A2016_01060 [Elusimicrobia bacterium GWF2_62_30]HBA59235.1 hypothetical protein [Elusimicrobiota bacterium]